MMKSSTSSQAQSQFWAEKIAFPTKPDGWTDISNYRVASLLKIDILLQIVDWFYLCVMVYTPLKVDGKVRSIFVWRFYFWAKSDIKQFHKGLFTFF